MTALNKQALREAAEIAASDSWGYDRDEFNDAITPEVALALLDELDAAEKRITELAAREVRLPAAWWVKQGSQSLLAYEKGMLLDALTAAGIITKLGE